MSSYQNRRGSAVINPTVDVNQRLENTSLIVPSATAYAIAFGFQYKADTQGGTEYLIRFGSSAANSPAIGLRNQAGSLRMVINHTTGSTTLVIGSLTIGHCYRVVLCGGTSLLAAASHTGANETDQRAVMYVYDCGAAGAGGAATRTPVATVTFSNDADLANALKASTTGINIQTQTGYTTFAVQDIAIWTGSSLSRTIADLYGQYKRNITRLGVTPNHAWMLGHYAAATIAASPTSGSDEEYALKDLGSGDGTSTRDLTPAGSTPPSWSTQNIAPAITSAEDPALAETWTDDHTRNTRQLKKRMRTADKGFVLVLAGDSICRETSGRYGGNMIESLIEAGYTLGSITWHWRTSYLPVKVTFPTMTGVTQTVYCNAEVDASTNYLTLQRPSSADRWGCMCGGIFELTGNGTPSLGANNRVMTHDCSNTILNATWFENGDRIKAQVGFFVGADAAQYADVVRCVGAGSTVDVDLGAATDFRQQPQDAVDWDTIASTGGGPVDDRIVTAYTLVDCGTSGTNRTIEFRLPNGLADTQKVRIANTRFIKCDASGNPLIGPRVFHVIVHFADSSSFIDLWKSQTCTADGQKRSSDDRLGRYLAAYYPDPGADLVYCQIQQTENDTQANNETNLGNLLTRWDGIAADMAITGETKYLLVAHVTNNVDKDSVVSDRVHLFDTRDAMVAVAEANPTNVACVSMLDRTKGYILDTTPHVVAGYTQFGIGESLEVEADATLLANVGGSGEALDAQILHPSTQAFAAAMTDFVVGEIEAANLGGGGANRDPVSMRLGLGL